PKWNSEEKNHKTTKTQRTQRFLICSLCPLCLCGSLLTYGRTVSFSLLTALPKFVVTLILPVEALDGMVITISVSEEEMTLAVAEPILTDLRLLKLCPLMSMVSPAEALVGRKRKIVVVVLPVA